MVLRDARDIGKKQEGPGQERWDKLARECGFMYKNRRIRKILRKKTRVKTKKNMNRVIVFESKQKHIKKEKIKKEKDVCSICCDSTENIKYINCKRGGIQSVNFGKYSECCKDKPICGGCRSKCSKCPFCKNHSLTPFKKTFSKKKPTFAVRQERIKLKKEAKEKAMWKAYKKAYRKAWQDAERFRDMHRQAWQRLRNRYDYSLRWEAEQMGFEWPRYRVFLCNEHGICKFPLSQFRVVVARSQIRILETEEQMLREQLEREDDERVRAMLYVLLC